MKVFVAGATGVIGRQLLPVLSAAGHEVTGMTRSARRAADTERNGHARMVVADALDPAAVAAAVSRAAPDAVVNMLTAIPPKVSPRRVDRDFAATNRLRTEGTANLLAAAQEAGARRIIAQSIAFAYEPGRSPADEDTPLWPDPPRRMAPVLGALRDLERQTTEAGGLVLRFGHLYGPGSVLAPDGSLTEQVRKGGLPLAGGGTAVFSFLHARDAATAVVAALDKDVTGVLNVADDDPAPMHVWLPHLARLLDVRPPRRVPAALVRPLAGAWGVAFMTRLRGADNSRARLSLDWRPHYTSWRQGFAEEPAAGAGKAA
ncbi:NAD(P)-dependent oxidoreductase [Streptomyces sodiiphilus]|uniref:NAD(P)-dependent oxidoreductase n=1 Tax=Streptomyces sodiiphilus TaxID=226217 RepID=A0ABN2PV96_9ACTN